MLNFFVTSKCNFSNLWVNLYIHKSREAVSWNQIINGRVKSSKIEIGSGAVNAGLVYGLGLKLRVGVS